MTVKGNAVARHELPALARLDLSVHRDKLLRDHMFCLAAGPGESREFEELAQFDLRLPDQDCFFVVHPGDLTPDLCRNQTKRGAETRIARWRGDG